MIKLVIQKIMKENKQFKTRIFQSNEEIDYELIDSALMLMNECSSKLQFWF